MDYCGEKPLDRSCGLKLMNDGSTAGLVEAELTEGGSEAKSEPVFGIPEGC